MHAMQTGNRLSRIARTDIKSTSPTESESPYAKSVPLCFIRLLRYWYKTQMMKVRWDNYFSESFLVSNGVRQGGILSSYLFSLYIDDLTSNLNTVKSGCYVGNNCLNYIFADDICLLSPSWFSRSFKYMLQLRLVT